MSRTSPGQHTCTPGKSCAESCEDKLVAAFKLSGAIDLISHFEDSPEELVIKGFRNMRLPFKVGIKRELWEKSDGVRAMYKSEDIKGKSRLYRKKDFHASET